MKMFFSRIRPAVKSLGNGLMYLWTKTKIALLSILIGFATPVVSYAQNAAGNYEAGTTALTTVTEEIVKYVPIMVKLCYAIAGIVGIIGAFSIYIAMNNDEQDVKKKMMLVIGGCIFFIAAAQAIPLFFGL